MCKCILIKPLQSPAVAREVDLCYFLHLNGKKPVKYKFIELRGNRRLDAPFEKEQGVLVVIG